MSDVTIPRETLRQLLNMYNLLCNVQAERVFTDIETGGCDNCPLYFECRRNGVYEKVLEILKKGE